MKAVRVHEYGKPAQQDDIPEPKIEDPDDIIVGVDAAGVCRTDLHILEGQLSDVASPPQVIGHENAGTVVDVGPGVKTLQKGDKVILHPLVSCGLCHACRAGDDMHCANSRFPGLDSDGGMAEYLRTSVRAAVKLDEGLEPADVAALADAGLTAYHAVRKAVPLLYPGTHAVMIGAGGLGHIGLQVALALTPAEITIIDRNPDALAKMAELGAHHTVLAEGDYVPQVMDITDGAGAEVVFDFVGEHGTEPLGVRMTRNAGAYYVIGYGGKLEVPTWEFIIREISVVGNLVGTYNDLVELMTLTAESKVRLNTKKYPRSDALTAIDDLDGGRIPGGRAILTA